MKFFPFENFYIITKLQVAEVQHRLENEVEPDTGFSFKDLFSSASSSLYFSGYVLNGTFKFKRVINYRNSFLPEIKGSTETYLDGSRVHVKMRLNTAVLLFMCVWLGGVTLAGIGIMVSSIIDRKFEWAMLLPLGMFAFGYTLATGGFKYESQKAKSKLLEILEGKMEEVL
jgi:hypothetical protein